jgi:hypothetical protein
MSEPPRNAAADPSDNPYAPPETPVGPPEQPARVTSARIARRRSFATETPSPYLVDCSCGMQVPVRASEAGSTVTCDCGAELRVPPLIRLRERSGIDPYESSTIDTIGRMLSQGLLPANEVCAVSGEPTFDVLYLTVKVPSAFKSKGGRAMQVLLALTISPWFFALPPLFKKIVPLEESTRTIEVPVRVAAHRQAKLRRASQNRLKRLLRTVPLYAKLLDENPIVIISVAPPESAAGLR